MRTDLISQRKFPWYVMLIGIYPAISLMGNNIWEVEPRIALRSIVACAILALGLLGVFWRITHNLERAGLMASVTWLLFSSYGHLYDYLSGHALLGMFIGQHRYLIPLSVLVFILAWVVFCQERVAAGASRLAVVCALGLVVLPLAQLGDYAIQNLRQENARPLPTASWMIEPASGQPRPDIYYIVLDTYGRDDALLQVMGYDNTPFLRQLQDMGFAVQPCSLSNYSYTIGSLSSSMNMDYLDALEDQNMHFQVRNNAVMETFRSLGYRSVAFETGYDWTQIKDADVYLRSPDSFWWMKPFEKMLIQSTALRLVQEAVNHFTPSKPANPLYVQRVQYELEMLEQLAREPGPKFVFLHMLIPHPPFHFDAEGALPFPRLTGMQGKTLVDADAYRRGYLGQLEYINQRLLETLPVLIRESKTPPVIILQGDHGFMGKGGRYSEILNAYYLPGEGEMPYASITPVNTFRLIFNRYFSAGLELLPDISPAQAAEDALELRPECSLQP